MDNNNMMMDEFKIVGILCAIITILFISSAFKVRKTDIMRFWARISVAMSYLFLGGYFFLVPTLGHSS